MVSRHLANRSFNGWRAKLRQLLGAATQTQSQCARDDATSVLRLLQQKTQRRKRWQMLLKR